jgi:hypothetical protein
MTQKASGYPPIGDLGVVGDGQSVALLGPEGTSSSSARCAEDREA